MECWGSDDRNQLPPSTKTTTAYSAISACAQGFATCALVESTGFAECWGYGAQTPPDTAYSDIATGYMHACALVKSSGFAECFGQDNNNWEGDHLTPPNPTTAYSAISTGVWHNCALKAANGVAECWVGRCWLTISKTPLTASTMVSALEATT